MKRIIMGLHVVIILLLNNLGYSQQISRLSNYTSYNVEILKVANESLSSFISKIPHENLMEYGLSKYSDISKVTYGIPIPVFSIVNDEVVFTSTWRVPLVIEDNYVALLTIIEQNDGFLAVDFGAKVLANEINSQKSIAILGMLRVYELKKDFLIEQFSKDSLRYIPIPISKTTLYLSQIIDLINE